jgi:hypothetical protein
MSAVRQEVAEDRPTNRARPGLEVDEQDNVAEYLEARLFRTASHSAACPGAHGSPSAVCLFRWTGTLHYS